MVSEGAEEHQQEELLSPLVATAGPKTALHQGVEEEEAVGIAEWPSVDGRSLKAGFANGGNNADGALGEVVAADPEPAGKDEKEKKKQKPPEEYFKIPHLKYEYKSTSHGDMALIQCQQLCDSKEDLCKSFSYDEKTEECLLSQATFAFNPGWVYYSKEPGDPPDVDKLMYRAIPGLKYQSGKGRKIQTGELDTCQKDCDADTECVGFGFSEATKMCGLAFDGALWMQDWSFYLKPAPKHDREEMLNLAKRRMPELKLKAYKQHRSRHESQYQERDSKEAADKEAERAKKAEIRIKETNEKELAEKKRKVERDTKEAEKKAEQEEINSKERKEKDDAKCKGALEAEHEAHTRWHTCSLSYDDQEAAAAEAGKGYKDAQTKTNEASVDERSTDRKSVV